MVIREIEIMKHLGRKALLGWSKKTSETVTFEMGLKEGGREVKPHECLREVSLRQKEELVQKPKEEIHFYIQGKTRCPSWLEWNEQAGIVENM